MQYDSGSWWESSLSRFKCGLLVGWFVIVLATAGWVLVEGSTPIVSARKLASKTPVREPVRSEEDPNAACATCHREIYDRYRKTPMANASGPAAAGFLPAEFTHEASGVSYRITENAGRVFLDFERRAASPEVTGNAPGSAPVGQELKGRRELKYFLGSGRRGRTYLFEQDGYWFEIPINWYAKKKLWDMAPGYLQAREMPLTLPVDPGCLRCHASGAAASMPEARNRYAGQPFAQGGVTCAACHGDAAAHVASAGKVALPKIDELEPTRRDSICLNCHLEGQVAVVHSGKRLVDFRPGDSIFDYISYYVREPASDRKDQTGALDRRATSQWEALLASGCKRGAGAKLTCTSCHDPHGTTAAMSQPERVAFYRQKCLACHATETAPPGIGAVSFESSHHPENPDCTSCHMPRAAANDIAHEQVTDHRIPRIAGQPGRATVNASGNTLLAVGDGTGRAIGKAESGDAELSRELERDLGLAYAQLAVRGDAEAAGRARTLLKSAESKQTTATDAELHGQLGFLEQISGDRDAAAREYELSLSADAENAFAAGNLALIRAQQKQYAAAAGLWEKAFQNDPVQLQAGMNLAVIDCGLGKRESALAALERILDFSPDNAKARAMLRDIRANAQSCSPH